jgi:hypothetical protein
MPEPVDQSAWTLDQQHAAFLNNKFLAMPIAGTIAWAGIGVAGALLPTDDAAWAVFIGTGGIYWLGVLVSRFTGEDLLGRRTKGNFFDRIFLLTVAMAVLVYAIAIPFFLVEPTSVPMSVAVLAGLMWVPFSGLIGHWVGVFHGATRTVLVVAAYYALPRQRFVVIPIVVVAIYLATIAVLVNRWNRMVRS